MKVGSQPIRLGDVGVLVLPTVFGHGDQRARWVPYAHILSVAVTERRGLRRGVLTLGLTRGESVEVRFSGYQQDAMLALGSELWRRVKGQRVESGEALDMDGSAG